MNYTHTHARTHTHTHTHRPKHTLTDTNTGSSLNECRRVYGGKWAGSTKLGWSCFKPTLPKPRWFDTHDLGDVCVSERVCERESEIVCV